MKIEVGIYTPLQSVCLTVSHRYFKTHASVMPAEAEITTITLRYNSIESFYNCYLVTRMNGVLFTRQIVRRHLVVNSVSEKYNRVHMFTIYHFTATPLGRVILV